MLYLENALRSQIVYHTAKDKRVYLCCHMLKCTCIDYVQGHLCKHMHKVRTMLHRWCKPFHYALYIMEINAEKMDCVPSCYSSDMDQLVETTLESSAEIIIGTCPVKKVSSGNTHNIYIISSVGMSLFCFFSHLFFFPAILLFSTYFS